MFGRVALALPVRAELAEWDLVADDVVVGDEQVVTDRADRRGPSRYARRPTTTSASCPHTRRSGNINTNNNRCGVGPLHAIAPGPVQVIVSKYANRRVMVVNLLLLMAVAFLPFPTKLVAEAIRNPDAERAAVIFYGGSLLVISLLFSALWGSVARNRSLLRPEVSEKEVNAIARATTPNLGFYVVVIVLAFLAPKVAAFGYLLIAIVALLRAHGDSAPTPTTAGSA